MIYIWLNIIPVNAAMLIALVIGGAYRALIGERAPSFTLAALSAVATFWLAAILAGALILAPPKADPWVMAIGSAVVIWAGFVLPSVAVTLAHRNVGAVRIASDCAYWLIVMTLQAIVMKLIGLVPPPV